MRTILRTVASARNARYPAGWSLGRQSNARNAFLLISSGLGLAITRAITGSCAIIVTTLLMFASRWTRQTSSCTRRRSGSCRGCENEVQVLWQATDMVALVRAEGPPAMLGRTSFHKRQAMTASGGRFFLGSLIQPLIRSLSYPPPIPKDI